MAEPLAIYEYFRDTGHTYQTVLYQVPVGSKYQIHKSGDPSLFANWHFIVDGTEWSHPPQGAIDEVEAILDTAAAGNQLWTDIVALVSPIVGTAYGSINAAQQAALVRALLYHVGALDADGEVKDFTQWG